MQRQMRSALQLSRLSRRQFMSQALSIGLGLSGITTALAGCANAPNTHKC